MSSSLPRKSYARIPVNIKLPNLIEVQLDSFERLKREGLGDLFHEVSPIDVSVREERLTEPFPKRLRCAEQQDADACDLPCRLRVNGERCSEDGTYIANERPPAHYWIT